MIEALEVQGTLSEEQQAVVDSFDSHDRPILVTGMAGTGKSHLLRALEEKFPTLSRSKTASTGIAALNVGGMTLHSFAGLGRDPKSAHVVYKRLINRTDQTVIDTIRRLKYLAVDEVSMIGAELLDLVNELFQIARKCDRPFGGVKVIFFGDFLQLPPVNDRFAFQSKIWQAAEPETHFLTHIYRQEDREFSEVLNEIRTGRRLDNGDMPERVCRFLHEARERVASKECPPIVMHTVNSDVDAENELMLSMVKGKLESYSATQWAKKNNNWLLNALDKNCRAPKDLRLKEGARVMLLANLDLSAQLANGSMGTVVGMRPRTVRVLFDSTERTVEIYRHTFEMVEHGEIVATREQFPLRLAYAITVHKSQGLTMDSAVVNIGGNFCPPGAAYVAFSRVKTPEGLHLGTTKKGAIKASTEALEFYGYA